MITIKMKPNSEVVYPSTIDRHDEIILVENWEDENEISMWHLPEKLLSSFRCRQSIGMWRVKPTDK